MKTFKGNLNASFTAVVPDGFLQGMREDAQKEDATPFLKLAQATHPVNDDAFLEFILKKGLRVGVQKSIASLLQDGGIGSRVAPPVVEIVADLPEFNSEVAIQTISIEPKAQEAVHDEPTPA